MSKTSFIFQFFSMKKASFFVVFNLISSISIDLSAIGKDCGKPMDPFSCAAGDQGPLEKALISAVRNGDFLKVKSSLKKGANVNARFTEDNITVLIAAAYDNSENIVKLLIERGADLEAEDRNGDTALEVAVTYGRINMVKLLVAHGAQIRNNVIMNAIGRRSVEMVQFLLDHVAGLDIVDNTEVLIEACKYGDLDIVKLLLDCGANVNEKDSLGDTALIYAARGGYINIVKLLVAHGAQIRKRAIKSAIGCRSVEMVQFLLDHVACFDIAHNTEALIEACKCGDLDIVKLFLNRGVNISEKDALGDTALACAAGGGYINIVKLLVAHGAQISEGAIKSAIARQSVEMVQFLLDHVAGFDIIDNTEALIYACDHYYYGDLDMFKLFLDRGANVNGKNSLGYTALQVAEHHKNMKIIKFLVAHGAQISEE